MPKPFLICLVIAAILCFVSAPHAQTRAPQTPAKQLQALFAAEWEYGLEQNPAGASQLGDRRWNDRWPDRSLGAIEKRHEHDLGLRQRLATINRARLSAADQLNYDLFKKDLDADIEEYKFRWYLVPLNQREGIQAADDLAASLRFETVKDYDDWVARLRTFPVYMDQTMALMREGIRARMVLPEVIMQRLPAQIDKQIVNSPQDSLFYKPFKRFPETVPVPEQERLMREAGAAINTGVIPAYKVQTIFCRRVFARQFQTSWRVADATGR